MRGPSVMACTLVASMDRARSHACTDRSSHMFGQISKSSSRAFPSEVNFSCVSTFDANSAVALYNTIPVMPHNAKRALAIGDDHLTGPNTLLRFLRSPNDPPLVGGPSKIELATRAWRRETPQLPGKAEILKEWILNTWDQKWTKSVRPSNTDTNVAVRRTIRSYSQLTWICCRRYSPTRLALFRLVISLATSTH